MFNRLFGEDQSESFIHSLPETSVSGFLFRLIKVLMGIILSLLIPIIFLAIFNINSDSQEQFLIIAIPLYVVMALLSVRYFYRSRDDLKRQLTSLRPKVVLKHLLFIMTPLYLALFLLQSAMFFFNPSYAKELLSLLEETPPTIFSPVIDGGLFILIWMLVGFAEEVFFRGAIYRALRGNFNKVIAVLVSSLLFVVPHSPNSPFVLSSIFLMGVVYSLYYEYKNNLLVPIILHLLQDFMVAGVIGYGSAYLVTALVQ